MVLSSHDRDYSYEFSASLNSDASIPELNLADLRRMRTGKGDQLYYNPPSNFSPRDDIAPEYIEARIVDGDKYDGDEEQDNGHILVVNK